jgi:protein SCO1
MKFIVVMSWLSLIGALAWVPLSSVQAASPTPDPLLEAGFDQALGVQLPLEIALRDETGSPVAIGDYFSARPVVLVFAYYNCPMLCNLVLADLTRSLAALEFNAGDEFEVITVSIDPQDQPELAAIKKAALLSEYERPGAERGWHFLTGDQKAIDALTRTAGFRYFYDESKNEYAHPAGLVVLTPEGRISRYFLGLSYSPTDLRLAIVEASVSRIGSWVDQVYLLCYEYDPTTGTYGLILSNVLRLAGLATVAGLGGLIGILLVRERSRQRFPG